MNIEFIGHDVDISNHLKEKLTNKFKKVEKHANRITRIQVTCSKDGDLFAMKALVTMPGHHQFFASEVSDDLYVRVDSLVNKLIRQIDDMH
ncbi:MAG: ribosomal subunit interface protein [Legionellales bacterium]|nr:ribosomal subunit interface protein [Legionellales bacterium]|tara:strand:- start:328 stop:600 length:273 start_codon:yes stop_codon:yes gene_type:complete